MPRFDVGDLIRMTITVKKLDGTLVDPDIVRLIVQPSVGPEVTYAYPGFNQDGNINRLSIGVYYFDLNISDPGAWKWRWETRGNGQSTKQGSFDVLPLDF